jgi:hypothetical protein
MHHGCNQAVIMFPRIIEEGINAHPVKKHKNIPEQDGQRMAHEQILKTPSPG